MRTAIVLGFVAHAAVGTVVQAQEPILAQLKGIKDLKISLGTNAAEPSVQMRCKEIGIERARLGFLRTGLLRFPVVREMELKLQDGAKTWASDLWEYAKTEEWLSNAALRGFRIVGSDGRLFLSASTAKFNMPLATLDLREINLEIGGHTLAEKFALIRLQGPKEGILELPGREIRVIDLPNSVALYEKD